MKITIAFASFLALTSAWESPQYTNYTRLWQAAFVGPRGQAPHPGSWNIITGDENYNNEFQRFTSSPRNVGLSGAGALQIQAQRDATAPKGWTSARIESKYTLIPRDGKVSRVESSLRLAGNPKEHKQGIWPAFWMLGDSYRKKLKEWPECGEIDIMENINGEPIAHATTHCDKYPGGACNEPVGLSSATTLADNKFHVWRVEFNRTSRDWKQQSITWTVDGRQFHRITGQTVNNATVWASLAQSPLYIILNIAVGGNWVSQPLWMSKLEDDLTDNRVQPGPPNANTWGGTGSMMEVGYVAHYVSK